MWTEAVRGLGAEVDFGGPEDPGDIAAAEDALSCVIPAELTSLLLEVGGVSVAGDHVVWGSAEMVRENLALRDSPDFANLYMSFDQLLFFGAGPGGDLFAHVLIPGREQDIFVWDHESDGRWVVAYGLRDYLRKAVAGAGGDWFRELRG